MSEDIKKKILDKIKQGEIAMKPRWHFVLKSVLIITGIVILSLGLLYVLSFIVFALRQSGVMFVPMFGFRGVLAFLHSSPWLLVGLAVVFLITLEVLVRKYSFAYKKPLLYILFGIVGISSFGTYVLAQTTLHQRIQEFTNDGKLRPVGAVYEAYSRPQLSDVHTGTVVEKNESGLIIENRRGEKMNVRIDTKTKLPKEEIQVGEQVVIFGHRIGEEIVAEGVRPLPRDAQFTPPRRGEHMQPNPQVKGKWMRMK